MMGDAITDDTMWHSVLLFDNGRRRSAVLVVVLLLSVGRKLFISLV